MAKLSTIVLFCFLIWESASSQRQVTTLSGQKIILFNDGQWQEMIKQEIETDSADLLINELDPMNTPVADTMNDASRQIWSQILLAAKSKEIKDFVVFDSLDREMAIVQISYEKAKKNTEAIEVYSDLIEKYPQSSDVLNAKKFKNLLESAAE